MARLPRKPACCSFVIEAYLLDNKFIYVIHLFILCRILKHFMIKLTFIGDIDWFKLSLKKTSIHLSWMSGQNTWTRILLIKLNQHCTIWMVCFIETFSIQIQGTWSQWNVKSGPHRLTKVVHIKGHPKQTYHTAFMLDKVACMHDCCSWLSNFTCQLPVASFTFLSNCGCIYF